MFIRHPSTVAPVATDWSQRIGRNGLVVVSCQTTRPGDGSQGNSGARATAGDREPSFLRKVRQHCLHDVHMFAHYRRRREINGSRHKKTRWINRLLVPPGHPSHATAVLLITYGNAFRKRPAIADAGAGDS